MKMVVSALLAVGVAVFATQPSLAQEQPKPFVTMTTAAQVMSVAFSPDCRMLASGGFDNAVTLWEVASGKKRATFEGRTNAILSVAFSPDGRTVASGGEDQTVKLWDVMMGKERATLKGHDREVRTVAFSPDGQTLASGGMDRTVKLWDVATGKELATLKVFNSWLNSLAFSSDGKTLALGGHELGVILWNIGAGKQQWSFDAKGPHWQVCAVAFASDGQTLASASIAEDPTSRGTVNLWDTTTGKKSAKVFAPRIAHVMGLAFNKTGSMLAMGAFGGAVVLWDFENNKESGSMRAGEIVNCVTFSSGDRFMASAGGNAIVLWKLPATKKAYK
jgi:WD40 repeat protein